MVNRLEVDIDLNVKLVDSESHNKDFERFDKKHLESQGFIDHVHMEGMSEAFPISDKEDYYHLIEVGGTSLHLFVNKHGFLLDKITLQIRGKRFDASNADHVSHFGIRTWEVLDVYHVSSVKNWIEGALRRTSARFPDYDLWCVEVVDVGGLFQSHSDRAEDIWALCREGE